MDWEPWVYTGERFKISHSTGWHPLPPLTFYALPRMVKHGNIYDLVRVCLTLIHRHARLHVCFVFMKCPLETSKHSDLGGAFHRLSLTLTGDVKSTQVVQVESNASIDS